ncbi:MAG: NPCBM/NEW2 domain-containing protein [Deltaproteobacteria bacterium]|nr:NPCBM/NEW2 domain-containing protein [Deltaproteobacteria bacterium]
MRLPAPLFVLTPLLVLGIHSCGTSGSAGARRDPTRSTEALPNAVWLEKLDLTKMSKRGRWATNAGKSTGQNPLRIGGAEFPHGVGMHAPGGMLIRLHGVALRFVARVGLDDEPATEYGTGSVSFEAWVDGRLSVATPVLSKGQSQLLDVDLKGAQTLELLTMDGDDGSNGDHADWAGAQIVLASARSQQPEAFIPPAEPAPPIAASDEKVLRLNGPRVVGTTPGRPFVYRLPITGPRPLRVAAQGLPRGLKLDPTTGIIRGKVARAGRNVVKLRITSKTLRKDETLAIDAGLGKLALTPPMGWSSWNVYGVDIDGEKMLATADALVRTGLANYGYNYVNMDDGWTNGRDDKGRLRVAAKMGALRKLADHIHDLGLRFGVYSSPGPKTCGGYEGSLGHEMDDAHSWEQWQVDYLKHDWCSYEKIATDESSLVALQKPYVVMNAALETVERDIVYALCQYGIGGVWNWGGSPQVGGHLWRTTGDLIDTWGSMWGIGFGQNMAAPHAGPGGWNDPDMLVVGWTGGWEGPARPTRLLPNEQILHVTQWSLLAAPLILGLELSKLDDFTRALLTNEEVIAVDQDALGKAATRRKREGRTEVWARPLEDGTVAVGLYNLGWQHTTVSITWADLNLKGPQPVRDLWQRKDIGVLNESVGLDVPQHGAVLLKVGKPNVAATR